MILAPYVSTRARHLEKGGESCVQNDKFIDFFEILEIIQDDPRWFQGSSGSFICHESSMKKVPIWRIGDVQKTPPRSHMNPQNHTKIHKSPVLAHNIHKDCPLGAAWGFYNGIWCEALSFIICSEGPEGEKSRFQRKSVLNQLQMLRSSNLKIFRPNWKITMTKIH